MFSELEKTSVFKGFTTAEIIKLLSSVHYRLHTYNPDDVIAYACDRCDDLFLLLQGEIRGEMNGYNDKNIVISEICAPDTFAEAFLFADNNELLINIISTTKTKILIISKSELLKMLNSNTKILNNYLNATSNRFVLISEKLKFLMFKTVKGKIANYILDLEREHSGKTYFPLGRNQEGLAALFGITRPALTRNLSQLKKDNIIEIKHKEVRILDRKRLVGYLS